MKFWSSTLALACLLLSPALSWAQPLPHPAASGRPLYSSKARQFSPAEVESLVAEWIERLEEMETQGRNFTADDRPWLAKMQIVMGAESMELPDLDNPPATKKVDCRLSWQEWAATHQGVQLLLATLRAMQAATNLKPQILRAADYQVPVYNKELFPYLHPSYTSAQLLQLRDLALRKGVFRLKISSSTGLVATSDIPTSQNEEMAARQWVTDTIYAGTLERLVDPHSWRQALETVARFYTSPREQMAFDRAIAHPETYRQGGPEEGVAHIFYPQTLERDPRWANNKRLESHGLALKTLVEAIKLGALSRDPNGLVEPSPQVLQAIANLTSYLVAIHYPDAPSAGNWEETPFPGGLTWDTQICNEALLVVQDFMFNPRYDSDPTISQLRRELGSLKHGEIFQDRVAIAQTLAQGMERLRRTYRAESPGNRELDASLVLLSKSPLTNLASEPVANARLHLENLQRLEDGLVRQHGMLRYAPFPFQLPSGETITSPDSYLNYNYHLACDPQGDINLKWYQSLRDFGSSDASDPQVFAARASLATPDCEAQWFLVSDLACAYAQQGLELLEEAQRRQHTQVRFQLTPQEEELLGLALSGAFRNLNRAYARLTPSTLTVKANGQPAPPWSVPEAWEGVSTLPPHSQIAYLPGINTPLTWAEASLWEATQRVLQLVAKDEMRRGQAPTPSQPRPQSLIPYSFSR